MDVTADDAVEPAANGFVLLTTQYLEEADQLADRVAIIDDGRIVADGSPAALKADIGEPLLTVTAAEGTDPAAIADVLSRFGPIVPGSAANGAGVRLPGGWSAMADAVRALDDEARLRDLGVAAQDLAHLLGRDEHRAHLGRLVRAAHPALDAHVRAAAGTGDTGAAA
mgnify:CR=1 FL=1